MVSLRLSCFWANSFSKSLVSSTQITSPLLTSSPTCTRISATGYVSCVVTLATLSLSTVPVTVMLSERLSLERVIVRWATLRCV